MFGIILLVIVSFAAGLAAGIMIGTELGYRKWESWWEANATEQARENRKTILG